MSLATAVASRPDRASPARLAFGRLVRNPLALVSLFVLLALTAACLAAPLVEQWLGVDANKANLLDRFLPPSAEHPLGTDELGRDLLVRLLYGGRVSLAVGFVAALVAAVIGSLIGLVSGFRGGDLDRFLMRLVDGMVALPLLPVLIVVAALDPAKLGLGTSHFASLYKIVAIIALFGWTTTARLVRGATLALKAREFVRAALALGAGPGRIMLSHILPNAASPILVATTLSIGNIILLESVLSFLGLGIQPPLPSWGNMLTNAQELIWQAPMLAVWPGLLIFVTVIAFNLLGDGLQEALDPRVTRQG